MLSMVVKVRIDEPSCYWLPWFTAKVNEFQLESISAGVGDSGIVGWGLGLRGRIDWVGVWMCVHACVYV